MKRTLVIAIIALGVGVGAGFYGARSIFPASTESVKNKNSPPPVQVSVAPLTADKPSGEGMTPDEMFTYLSEMPPGIEFDATYMNYLIKFRSTGSAMSRIARDKATNAELKAYSAQLYDAEQQYVAELYSRQRAWGFTHH